MDMIDAPHTILCHRGQQRHSPGAFEMLVVCGILICNVSSTAHSDCGALMGSKLLVVNWLFDMLKYNLGEKMERREHKISCGEICSVWFNHLNLVLSHVHQPTTITHQFSKLKKQNTKHSQTTRQVTVKRKVKESFHRWDVMVATDADTL